MGPRKADRFSPRLSRSGRVSGFVSSIIQDQGYAEFEAAGVDSKNHLSIHRVFMKRLLLAGHCGRCDVVADNGLCPNLVAFTFEMLKTLLCDSRRQDRPVWHSAGKARDTCLSALAFPLRAVTSATEVVCTGDHFVASHFL